MFFEQIEKFQCLDHLLLKAHKIVPSKDTWHVSRVHKRVLKLVNLFVQNLQKLNMIDLGIISPLICDALWSICHKGGLWAPLLNSFAVLHLQGHNQWAMSDIMYYITVTPIWALVTF